MVTVTAPGDDRLPRRPDGMCEISPLAEWCSTMMERWHGLRNRSRWRALRSGSGLVVLSYVWQLQKRGAPHLHIVVPAGVTGQKFAYAVKDSAAEFDFGFVDIRSGGEFAVAAASYVSRYLVRDLELTGGEYAQFLPSRPAYINRELCRKAGVGIAVARKVRHLWVYANRDDEIGVPKFVNDWQESATYYWHRVNKHGLDNVRRPAIFDV